MQDILLNFFRDLTNMEIDAKSHLWAYTSKFSNNLHEILLSINNQLHKIYLNLNFA